ncbi:hypothetical protein MJ_ECL16 (plasmid) [Methanocaldococcus jannaschii DSM 2661]|uniref:Uncharacterized protein MJECL16 n=1 Tax=Methanocaldococcus jannaschii (strain ATCC 43067 / DSM 2661 / JAL-1 / JCM 10045 / NBRC 100440) TaxID=243232 RepID=Y3516_METJA|nr:RecName: Full=Uncharacterized protein MJECL16 [Methanocaldococcus jannaschii DSM 2661]AAC37072.1 hypothetical protein MJ_ECL16 [Methanocaldococcus jannaschii DSM 2661]
MSILISNKQFNHGLKDEFATKKDLELLEERILRYVDNKFNQLDKKIDRTFYLLVFFIILWVSREAFFYLI